MKGEDIVLAAGGAAAGLSAAGQFLSGDPTYGKVAVVLLAVAAFLKAVWPNKQAA